MFVCTICVCVCAVLEQRSHCAKWPVTEVFHVNPWFTLSPHVTANTHAQNVDFLLTPYYGLRGHTLTPTPARKLSAHQKYCDSVLLAHISLNAYNSLRLGSDVSCEMITILFHLSVVLFYWYRKWRRTPNKQTAKEKKPYRASKPPRDAVNETCDWLILADTINLNKNTTSQNLCPLVYIKQNSVAKFCFINVRSSTTLNSNMFFFFSPLSFYLTIC